MTSELAEKVEQTENYQAAIADRPNTTIFDLVKRMDGRLRDVLPKTIDANRFIGLALTELRIVPRLAECSQESILAGLMKAAQRGLEIDSTRGQAYLIPRKNKATGHLEASFQIGYHGWIDLFGRAEIRVNARAVHEGDQFDYAFGLNEFLAHKPARKDRGPVTDFYAVVRFPNGDSTFDVMSLAEVEEHRDRFASSRYNGKIIGPWVENFDSMALKSVLLRAVKYVALPAAILNALHVDDIPMDVAPDERALPAGRAQAIDVDAVTDDEPTAPPADPAAAADAQAERANDKRDAKLADLEEQAAEDFRRREAEATS